MHAASERGREERRDTNEILLTHAVRNNAEVVLGDIVRVAKALNVVEARSVTLTSTNEKRLVQHLKDTGMKRSFPAMFVNTPVLKGDYVISIGPMGPWYVFEVIDIEVATDDAKSLAEALAGKQSKLDEPPVAVITEKTEVIPVDFDNVQRIFPSDVQRRGNSCPVFWIHVTDKLQKLDAESVYLVVTFTCLHLGGIISGQYERKIDKNTDIQGLVMQYSDAAKQLIDIINEEARARTVDASEVKNRIMQKWMEI